MNDNFNTLFLLLILIPCTSSRDSPLSTENDAGDSSSSVISCGDLHDFRCPFTLQGHPRNCPNLCTSRFGNLMKPFSCGYSPATRILSCENNTTIYTYLSKKFHVMDIDYQDHSIRLFDPGLQKENCSSMPGHSLPGSNYLWDFADLSYRAKAVVYMNCLANISSYINTSPCVKAPSNMFSYIVINPQVSDFKDSCDYYHTAWMTTNKKTFGSYLDVHNEMMNGFVVYWHYNNMRKPGVLYYIKYNILEYGTNILFAGGSYLLGRSILGGLCVLLISIHMVEKRNRTMNASVEDFLNTYGNQMPTRYSYKDVKRMTRDFKEKLGQGGFGSVYKGSLGDKRAVAIKILSSSKGNGQDFINEVATIGRIHHVNVVQLIGFVAERSRRALVYDLMPNGSLEKYIFPREKGKPTTNLLSWEKTFEIALGTARGIEYLHRGCDMRILHFDIKPHNILLDENYNPKVSDFGLARLYSKDDSIVSLTMARGTIGYMAPELFYRSIGGVSYKSDVYSFGMLLMEMAGRRKNLTALAENSSQIYFPSWIYNKLNQGEDIEMEDATEEENEIAKKLIIVAMWCIQLKPIDRPSMTKVVEMLEGELGLLQIPQKPFSITEEHENDTSATGTTPSTTLTD